MKISINFLVYGLIICLPYCLLKNKSMKEKVKKTLQLNSQCTQTLSATGTSSINTPTDLIKINIRMMKIFYNQ